MALAEAVTALGALLAAVPELDEIEINPLRATADGRLLALDVVVGAAEPRELRCLPGTDLRRHVLDAAHSPAVAALADGQGGH